jgi:hypothetical protein
MKIYYSQKKKKKKSHYLLLESSLHTSMKLQHRLILGPIVFYALGPYILIQLKQFLNVLILTLEKVIDSWHNNDCWVLSAELIKSSHSSSRLVSFPLPFVFSPFKNTKGILIRPSSPFIFLFYRDSFAQILNYLLSFYLIWSCVSGFLDPTCHMGGGDNSQLISVYPEELFFQSILFAILL